ncbi:cell surface protein, partial [Clostridium tetani]
MNNKKKIIIACITILSMFLCGIFIKSYKTNSETTSSTRVVQEEKKKQDKEQQEKKKEENSNKDEGKEKTEEAKEKEEEKKKKDKGKEKAKKKEEEKKETLKEEKKPSSNPSRSENEEIGEKRTVHIRIEGYDKTLVSRTKITTGIFDLNPYSGPATGSSATPSKGWGIDKFKEPTNAHAVVKALEQNGFKKGSGYDLQDYGWSLYIAMVGGDREFDYRSTSGWMYRVNNVLPNVGCQGRPINNGDEILWYFGAYGFDTLATELKVNVDSIGVGQSITVTLNGIKNDINTWKEFREPVKGATIYANG